MTNRALPAPAMNPSLASHHERETQPENSGQRLLVIVVSITGYLREKKEYGGGSSFLSTMELP